MFVKPSRGANAMPKCQLADQCAFFETEVGYSPELYSVMRQRYCHSADADCARLLAGEKLGHDNVPPVLMPTEHHLVDRL
jgi:hypothetical protein